MLAAVSGAGSVKPGRMAVVMLRRANWPKQPKNSISEVNLQVSMG
jgi:hypothetical protein